MSYVRFNQPRMNIHVAEPGATAVISGTWAGPSGSKFSLQGMTASGHWDALDANWRIGPGTWDATVRFYRTGPIGLTVRLIPSASAPTGTDATAQAEVTMDR